VKEVEMKRPDAAFGRTSAFAAALLCAAIALTLGCGKRDKKQETAPEKDQATAAREPKDQATAAREPKASEGAVKVTDANFAEFTGKGVVLVDFWAARCPPCRTQGPIVDKIAGKFAGRAKVGKFDVDANNNMPRKFGLRYIPTLIVFKDGNEVKRFTGLQEETALASALEEVMRGE